MFGQSNSLFPIARTSENRTSCPPELRQGDSAADCQLVNATMTAHNSIRAGKSRQTDSREWDAIKANSVPKTASECKLLSIYEL